MSDSSDIFKNPVSEFIWTDKYKAKSDNTIHDTWKRVARSLASVEKDSAKWEAIFFKALEDFKVLPGGRILANAGVSEDHKSTLINCFVSPVLEDSMESIFETAKRAALTLKSGGGIGFDFSNLRPKNSPVTGINHGIASGPVSFMSVFDNICKTVMAGNRRGAMIGILRVDHPDIEEFVMCKDGSTYLSTMNLSVAITDNFMKAVQLNEDFELKFNGQTYKTINAKDLFDKIIRHTYEYSEPGVIFIDTVNRLNNLYYCEEIKASNPCGEQMMGPGSSCNLISINLTKFVDDPFLPSASINFDKLVDATKVAVRMGDNVVDVTNYPLEIYRENSLQKRRVGLGITGLSDMLAMLGLSYDSHEAQRFAENVMKTIKEVAYDTSSDLAAEKGSFPAFQSTKYLKSVFVQTLPREIITKIKTSGMRNSHLLSIQPTGTVSLLANNVSSGLEPIFSLSMKRHIKDREGNELKFDLNDYAYHEALKHWPESKIKQVFKTVKDLSIDAHVTMQAILQRHVDSSISKTINIPTDYSFEAFRTVYWDAYKVGIKGVTTFRPTEKMRGIIVDETVKRGDPVAKLKQIRPYELSGRTYKVKDPKQKHAYYVTINDFVNEITGVSRPWEIFLNSKSEENDQWVKALSVLLSEVFKRVDDPSFVAEALRLISDSKGGFFDRGKFHSSLVARVGALILEHINCAHNGQNSDIINNEHSLFALCPQCGEKTLRKNESCEDCMNCGFSKCG